jgi:hypothetical protein
MLSHQFKCELCGNTGIDNFKILSDSGMLLRGNKQENALNDLTRNLYSAAKAEEKKLAEQKRQEEQRKAAERAEAERIAKEKRERELAAQKAKEDEEKRKRAATKQAVQTNNYNNMTGVNKRMNQMWEYKVICGYEGLPSHANFEQKDRQMEAVLNRYGAMGWELVQEHNYTVILKRPMQF